MARPVSNWDESDLQAFIDNATEEGASLEFKGAGALDRKNPSRNGEMCKDASGMANAAGGVIIYGIAERDSPGPERVGVADHLDACDPSKVNKDEIERVLTGGIEPRLQGVEIRRIDLKSGGVAFTVSIPQSTTLAPHQSKRHCQYFRRWNTQVLAMLDHEVRDLMRRGNTPSLCLDYQIQDFDRGNNIYALRITYSNLSSEPALYSAVGLTFEDGMGLPLYNVNLFSSSKSKLQLSRDDIEMLCFTRLFNPIKDFPIFKEHGTQIFSQNLTISPDKRFYIGHTISCPGFSVAKLGYILRPRGGLPTITWVEQESLGS